MEGTTFNLIDDIENSFEQQNGKAPEPEAPPIDSEDWDDIGSDERQHTSENRKTEFQEEQQQRQQATEAMIEAQAGMITNLVNMVNKTLCAWISKGDRDNYSISKSELSDYKEVTKDYLKTVEKPVMTPAETFLATTFILVGGNVLVALDDKKKNERRKNEEEAMKKAAEAKTYQEAQAAKEDLERAMKDAPRQEAAAPRRNQFQVDAKGFYIYSVSGQHLKGKQKTEKAPADVLQLIERMQADGLSKGQINEQIRFKKYGTTSPV